MEAAIELKGRIEIGELRVGPATEREIDLELLRRVIGRLRVVGSRNGVSVLLLTLPDREARALIAEIGDWPEPPAERQIILGAQAERDEFALLAADVAAKADAMVRHPGDWVADET